MGQQTTQLNAVLVEDLSTLEETHRSHKEHLPKNVLSGRECVRVSECEPMRGVFPGHIRRVGRSVDHAIEC